MNCYWSKGLVAAINDANNIILRSEAAVVIKDKFPKAKYHFLVLPEANISNIYSLGKQHLDLLDELRLLATNIIEVNGLIESDFKIGYHLSPSMDRLHLHVISDDFISPCLKTKLHWNTFTTKLFIDHHFVYDTIKSNGQLEKPSPELLTDLRSTPLKCHKCPYQPKNIPDLKEHIQKHVK